MIELIRGSYDFERCESTYRVVDERNRSFNVTAKGPITFRKLKLVRVDTGELDKNSGNTVMRDAIMCEREDFVADAPTWKTLT